MLQNTKDFIQTQYTPLTILSESSRAKVEVVKDSHKILAIQKSIRSPDTVYPILKTIRHPGLAKIYDLYCGADETIVIEEYIGGETLQHKLENGTVFSIVQLHNWAVQLCNILCYIHAENLIHRDIKPSNIIISGDNILKLIDFDSARTFTSGQSTDTVSLGTKGYAAPEQYGYAQTDARSDIYSFGVLFRQLFTGQLLGTSVSNPDFERILTKCTQMDPANRYQNAAALLQDLQLQQTPPKPTKNKELQTSRLRYTFSVNRLWIFLLFSLYTVLIVYAAANDDQYRRIFSYIIFIWICLIPAAYALNLFQFRTLPFIPPFKRTRKLVSYGFLLLLIWFIGLVILAELGPFFIIK